jgi:cytochrome c-type biogenesis protein CcmH/NrfF
VLDRIFAQVLCGFLVLATAHPMADTDAARLRSLSQKMKCDCGCRDVLAECAHKECTRRPKLKQEIMDGVLYGESDDQILQNMAAAHGTALLVTPMFRGFDALLWIVPTLAGILVLGLMAYRFRKVKPN